MPLTAIFLRRGSQVLISRAACTFAQVFIKVSPRLTYDPSLFLFTLTLFHDPLTVFYCALVSSTLLGQAQLKKKKKLFCALITSILNGRCVNFLCCSLLLRRREDLASLSVRLSSLTILSARINYFKFIFPLSHTFVFNSPGFLRRKESWGIDRHTHTKSYFLFLHWRKRVECPLSNEESGKLI